MTAWRARAHTLSGVAGFNGPGPAKVHLEAIAGLSDEA
jgi:hypothetical protein